MSTNLFAPTTKYFAYCVRTCHDCLIVTAKTSVNDESSDENDPHLDMTACKQQARPWSQHPNIQVPRTVKCVECVCFLAFVLVVSTFAPNVALLFMLGAATMKIYQVQQSLYVTFVAASDIECNGYLHTMYTALLCTLLDLTLI